MVQNADTQDTQDTEDTQDTQDTKDTVESGTTPIPLVLIVSLCPGIFADAILARICTLFAPHAVVKNITDKRALRRALHSFRRPAAIACTDAEITSSRLRSLGPQLIAYVRESGGICVFMGEFCRTADPPSLEIFFLKAGLRWSLCTTYHVHRTGDTFVLNQAAHDVANNPKNLSSRIHCTSPQQGHLAILLKNVMFTDAWYVSESDATAVSCLAELVRQVTFVQTPVALARIGLGKVGYVGDIPDTEASDTLVLAMCGL